MRSGKCTAVLTGDTIILDDGRVQVRLSNVWAPSLGSPLGDAMHDYTRGLILGHSVRYVPNGHIHWGDQSLVAEVYLDLDSTWLNQTLRDWLSRRVHNLQWVDGIPSQTTP